MPTPNQVLAMSLLASWFLMTLFWQPLMKPLKPFLPDCTYIAWGACVHKRG